MQNDFDSQADDSLAVPKPSPSPEATTASTSKVFQGNGYDLVAFIGVVVGGVTLLSCVTLGVGQYCMPFVPIVLGIIGLTTAKDSLDPARTRRLSWLSLGAGAVILLVIVIIAVLYIGLIAFGAAADGGF